MKDLVKLFVCWLAFLAALFIDAILSGALHLHTANLQGSTKIGALFLLQMLSGAILVIGLYPLARHLAAPRCTCACAIGSFLLLAFGVNGIIEAAKFSHMIDNAIPSVALFYFAIAILVGCTMGLFFGAPGPAVGFPHRALPAWQPMRAAPTVIPP